MGGQTVSYQVDGGESAEGTTDEEGLLQITLADGAHGVRLNGDQQEVYIDNYSGFGITVDEYREQPVLVFAQESGEAQADGESESAAPETTAVSQTSEETESAAAPADSETGSGSFVIPILVVLVCLGVAVEVMKKRK